MKNIFTIAFLLLLFTSCTEEEKVDAAQNPDWKDRKASIENYTEYHQGKTYLPVYSHIYHTEESEMFNLSNTISIRNVSLTDSIYILNADYYNTSGENIRHYLKYPIYLKPIETIEIITTEKDNAGGSGANFVFDWATKEGKNPPLFEAVMISTYGQQGISFTTRGVVISE